MSLLTTPGRHRILAAACLAAAILFLDALWIPLKAGAAQVLLDRSWRLALAGHADTKPWPWADTRPVAILEVPRLGQRKIVLQGSSGRNLAFGPTLVNATPVDETGDRILSGHRDTHFHFLKDLREGDLLRLVTPASSRDYRVRWMETVDTRQQRLVIDDGIERLTLVTCYPFDAPFSGSPLRRVVTAIPANL